MFVTKDENMGIALSFWKGKPSGSLMWILDADASMLQEVARQASCDNPIEFIQKNLAV